MTTGPKPNLAVRRLAGAVVAALAAASAGTLAQAQQAPQSGHVTSAAGNIVTTSYGECWRGGAAPQGMAQCPPATAGTTAQSTRVAQATPRERSPATPAAAPAAAGAGAGVIERGYVNSPEGVNVRNPYGQCWRAGYWTPALAAEPCDATARASVPPPVVAAAPQPEPAPVPQARPEPAPVAQAAPEPPRPVLQKVTLSTDVLFEFNKAELRDEGKKKLDEIADGLKDARIDEIVAIGHADRIASEQYNQKLSEARAQAVKEHLAQRGLGEDKVKVEGRGEQQPVTGEDCAKMGPERASNKKLVQCLQPDRRVEIEVFGTREVASSGEQPAAGGTAGTPSGTGSGGSSR